MARAKNIDRKLLSKEKHELDYVKRVARQILKKTKDLNPEGEVSVEVGQLRRLCKYISSKR
jgi:hypothetical protein